MTELTEPVALPGVVDGGGRRARVAMLRPFAIRDFRLLWAGESISMLGDQFHFVALAWLVLSLSDSGVALSAVLLAASIPRLLLMLVGGALSDRRAPRTLMLLSNIARGALVAGLTILIVSGRVELWHLLILGVVFGAVDALFLPAMNTLIPMLVPTERLPAANALVQATAQFAGLVGPAVAGVMIAIAGIAPAFAIDALSFGAAAVALAAIHGGRRGTSTAGSTESIAGDAEATAQPALSMLGSIRAGAAYAFADPAIRQFIVIVAVINLAFNGPVAVGLPWLATHRFEGGSAALGALFAGFAGGALVGALVAGSLGSPRHLGLIVLAILTAVGVGLATLGFASNAALAVAILAAMGLGIGYLNVVAIAWLQARTDPDLRGRVMSLAMLSSFGLGPISIVLAGVLVDTGSTAMYLAAGGLVVLTALSGLLTGFHRRLDTPTPALEG